jgi:hypothetical protein
MYCFSSCGPISALATTDGLIAVTRCCRRRGALSGGDPATLEGDVGRATDVGSRLFPRRGEADRDLPYYDPSISPTATGHYAGSKRLPPAHSPEPNPRRSSFAFGGFPCPVQRRTAERYKGAAIPVLTLPCQDGTDSSNPLSSSGESATNQRTGDEAVNRAPLRRRSFPASRDPRIPWHGIFWRWAVAQDRISSLRTRGHWLTLSSIGHAA